MKKLVLADAAVADLEDIARRTESEWGKARKQAYLAAMRERMSRLCKYPSLGVARDEVAPGHRSTLSARHVIFYRERADAIEIVRVLHENMDVHSRLSLESKDALSDVPQRSLRPSRKKQGAKKGRRRGGRVGSPRQRR
ncbi:MAG: type II toxin-antitoxin system RelE/ParE family toxin [Rhodospirillales bacterium]|nr:type II toxin-antitoxin system RelE/ParE family toxin [Rhodospirillales bacterium]